jgi:AraC-like DNA-binding protein
MVIKMSKNFVFSNEWYNPFLFVTSGGFEATTPSHQYGPGGRSGYMLHYISDGKGTFISNNTHYHLKKGDFLYIQPQKTVTMIADKNDPWSFYWIRFTGELVQKYMERINISYKDPILSIKDSMLIPQKIVEIVNYSQSPDSSDFLYSSKLMEIFNEFYRILPNVDEKSVNSPEKIFTRAVFYIRNNYESPISINDVVNYVSIDRTYLYKLFKENLNIGPKEYLTKYRLKKAAEMLKTSPETIAIIAQSSGFSSYEGFTKTFHKYMGCSPTEYKSNLSDNIH